MSRESDLGDVLHAYCGTLVGCPENCVKPVDVASLYRGSDSPICVLALHGRWRFFPDLQKVQVVSKVANGSRTSSDPFESMESNFGTAKFRSKSKAVGCSSDRTVSEDLVNVGCRRT